MRNNHMPTTIEVIRGAYQPSTDTMTRTLQRFDIVWDERHTDSPTMEEFVVAMAEKLIEPWTCVIVRPRYNAGPEIGSGYYEWRSFDGKPFQKIHFKVG